MKDKFCPSTGKRCYPTEQYAKKHKPRRSGDRIRVYFCDMCKHYHFTSTPADKSWR